MGMEIPQRFPLPRELEKESIYYGENSVEIVLGFYGNPIETLRDFYGDSMGIPTEILWEWKSSSNSNPDTNRITSKQGRIIMRQ